MAKPPFVTRVQLRDFKSIDACDVSLGPLAILVGANGSGKSNFLDALRLTADALTTTLDLALRQRGGLAWVCRRTGGAATAFSVRLDLRLEAMAAHYAFEVRRTARGFRVSREECSVESRDGAPPTWFRINEDQLDSNLGDILPARADDRLYLVSVSGAGPLRLLHDALTDMSFYNLSPDEMAQPQKPDAGQRLRPKGENLASVVGQMRDEHPEVLDRVVEYLTAVSPAVAGVLRVNEGSLERVEFVKSINGAPRLPWFPASAMSEGTVRALGVLVALLQSNGSPPSLVGLEEPETALHPAAVGILIDAIRDAAAHTQVIITSHSPDLLDRSDIDDAALLAVETRHGQSLIGPLDQVGRDVLRERLFTPGELLRLGQLEPAASSAHLSNGAESVDLFTL